MADYSDAYPETGSGNISKATPEWAAVLAEARKRRQDLPELEGEYLLHTAYDIVNEQVGTAGIPWAKCANCGSPFIVKDGGGMTVCSTSCHADYLAYITAEAKGMFR